MLMALLQMAYVVWMFLLPDWSTVWVAMIVFAVAASVYSMGLAITLTTLEADLHRMPLDLENVRRRGVQWCAIMLAGSSLATYACGRISYVWHRKVQLANSMRSLTPAAARA